MSKGMIRCPCGEPRAVTCAHCGRHCCLDHYAYTPTGTSVLKPACFPVCTAPWWKTASVDGYAARNAQSADDREALKLAGRLLLRGGDVAAVAGELGLTEARVRDVSRHIEVQP